jgi:DNA invertase Pin-like site-specific DNA recombinase
MAKKRTRAGDPLLAVGYLRVSKSEQKLGPHDQIKSLHRWVDCEGSTLVAVFFDFGESGDSQLNERPGLVGALAALESLGAGVLLAANRSRVARDIEIIRSVERLAVKNGAVLRTADGISDGDSEDESGHIRKGFDDLLNEAELRRIRARTKAALAVKKAKGEMCGKPPFGMKLAADGVHMVPDEAEQAIIERVVRLHSAFSERDIVDQLADEGVVGRTGKPLQRGQVHRILATARAAQASRAA